MFVLSRHPVSCFCQHATPAPVNSHRTWSIPFSTQSDFAFFPHQNVCQPSFSQSKVAFDWRTAESCANGDRWPGKSTSLGQNVETPQISIGHGLLHASDETVSRAACLGTELHCKPTRSVDQLCDMCLSPTLRSSTHCSDDVRADTVIGLSARGSETNVTPERERLHSERGEGHDCRSRGTEASKQEGSTTTNDRVQHRVQFWSGIQGDDHLGDASAQRNLDAINTSCLPDDSSLAPLCCEHLSDGKDEGTAGKCFENRRGLVKNLTLVTETSAKCIAGQCGSCTTNLVQTVLDAATADRCDCVEVCCSDALFSDRSHATTWDLFVFRVIAHQNNDTLQGSSQTNFSTVFRVCGSSLAIWWSHLLGMAFEDESVASASRLPCLDAAHGWSAAV